MEAEGSTGQAVVAAAVVAAGAGEGRPAVQEAVAQGAGLASRSAGDANRCPTPGHPGHKDIDQGPEQEPNQYGQAEGQDQLVCKKNSGTLNLCGVSIPGPVPNLNTEAYLVC